MAGSRGRKPVSQGAKEVQGRLGRFELRPVVFWLPDASTPEFAAEARRQSRAISRSPQERRDIDFVESVAELLEDK